MQPRQTPLKLPEPLRHPYQSVIVGDKVYVMRVLSLYALTKALRDSLSDQSISRLVMIADPEVRSNLYAIIKASPDLCEVFGAVIGLSWSDPHRRLEATPTTPLDVSTYGAAVFEELHEEGWVLSEIADLALALLEQFYASNTINERVTERAAFFLRPKEPSTQSESLSSATSSEDGEAVPYTK